MLNFTKDVKLEEIQIICCSFTLQFRDSVCFKKMWESEKAIFQLIKKIVFLPHNKLKAAEPQ